MNQYNNPQHTEHHEFTICQQNPNKNLNAQLDLLHYLDPKDYDIIAMQEPWIDHLGHTRAGPRWEVQHHLDNPKKTRAALLINKKISTNTWIDIPTGSQDVSAVKFTKDQEDLYLFNIYNDCNNSDSLTALETTL